jgi:hypothetical protein
MTTTNTSNIFTFTTLNNRTANLVGWGEESNFDSHRGCEGSRDFAVLKDTVTGHTFHLGWDVVMPQVISQGLVPVVSDKNGSSKSKSVDTDYHGVYFDGFGGACEHSTTTETTTFTEDVVNWVTVDYSQGGWVFSDFTTHEDNPFAPTGYSQTWVTCVPKWFQSAHAEWVDEVNSRAAAEEVTPDCEWDGTAVAATED